MSVTPKLLLAIVCMLMAATAAHALTPLPQPQPAPDVVAGKSAPFAGRWSVSLPTMDLGKPDVEFATCKLPVRIEAEGAADIYYLAPRQTNRDAQLALSQRGIGTVWEDLSPGNGPSYFTVWIDADTFYLYDVVPETDVDWGHPFIYRRCP